MERSLTVTLLSFVGLDLLKAKRNLFLSGSAASLVSRKEDMVATTAEMDPMFGSAHDRIVCQAH